MYTRDLSSELLEAFGLSDLVSPFLLVLNPFYWHTYLMVADIHIASHHLAGLMAKSFSLLALALACTIVSRY